MALAYILLLLPFNVLRAALIFIIAKILTQNWKFSPKETLYFVLASLLISTTNFILFYLGSFFAFLLNETVVVLLPVFYFHKIRSYPIKASIILMLLSLLIYTIASQIITSIFTLLGPFPISLKEHFNSALYFMLAWYILAITISIFLTKVSKKLRGFVRQADRLQTVILYFSIPLYFLVQIALSSEGLYFRIQWPMLIVIALTVISLCIFLYVRFINTKHEHQRKDDAYQGLQYYTNELEQHQTAVRNFEHDYRNILSSLDSFIEEDDFAGLKQYYTSKIKVISETITHNHFALEALNKIKIREIKGVLSSKLILAQSEGIDAIIETDGEIDHIPIDTVALVRMLGIIMDNAIEELVSLGHGILRVGCFKEDGEVLFIVQNTCRPDMPSLRELRQSGFSSKGKHRGLGLNNLFELSNSIPNLILDTNIVENSFIQRMTIVEAEGESI